MSQKEIADQMQLSQSTVEKHIAKGLLQTMLYMREYEQGPQQTNPKAQAHPISVKRVSE
ncbi:RNA polymerase sigma-70 factor, ECF subfamily [Pseudoalteromonas sp. BSi20652]|nr:RNA polymerase sigma-70 factor, ECF subfamily [Pseudoalteromonas sp. BSi20652]